MKQYNTISPWRKKQIYSVIADLTQKALAFMMNWMLQKKESDYQAIGPLAFQITIQ